MRLTVRAPASTSNLGPGFDSLGLALSLCLELTAVPGNGRIRVRGRDAERIPTGPDNLVRATAAALCGARLDRFDLVVDSEIPLARGLGSSAAARAAGTALGLFLRDGREPERSALLAAVADAEGHPDNAAAAVLGGLTVSGTGPNGPLAARLPFPEEVVPVLFVPEVEVSTPAARRALPAQVPLADAAFNVQRTALLVAALVEGRPRDLRAALHDRLHQRHRLALVPGLADALRAVDALDGCWGCFLSGSGPTVVALAQRELAGAVATSGRAPFAGAGLPAEAVIAEVDGDGARVTLTP